MADLPRDTKIHIILWEERGKGKDSFPIAWANCLLYNYKHELRQGGLSFKMWEGQPKVMGTCVPVCLPITDMTNYLRIFPNLWLLFSKSSSILSLPSLWSSPRNPLNFVCFLVAIFLTIPVPFPKIPEPTAAEKKKLEAVKNMRLWYQSFFSLTLSQILWPKLLQRPVCKFGSTETILCSSLKYLLDISRLLIFKALPKYLISVPKTNKVAIQEMHVLLKQWTKGDPVDALEVRRCLCYPLIL